MDLFKPQCRICRLRRRGDAEQRPQDRSSEKSKSILTERFAELRGNGLSVGWMKGFRKLQWGRQKTLIKNQILPLASTSLKVLNRSCLEQWFPNHRVPPYYLEGGPESLILRAWGGTQEFTFLTASQGLLTLLVPLENGCSRVWFSESICGLGI